MDTRRRTKHRRSGSLGRMVRSAIQPLSLRIVKDLVNDARFERSAVVEHRHSLPTTPESSLEEAKTNRSPERRASSPGRDEAFRAPCRTRFMNEMRASHQGVSRVQGFE